MVYISLTTIPQRVKNLNKSVESLLKQTLKPDKIFVNIPTKFKRFKETIEESNIKHEATGRDIRKKTTVV